ncbi:MAG: relaxase MobL [Bacillota bacterium]
MASGNEINFFFNFTPPEPRSLNQKSDVSSWEKKRAFFTCNSKNSHLAYMETGSPKDYGYYLEATRGDSVPNNTKKSYVDYMDDKKKQTRNKQERSTGLFDRGGMLSEERKQKHREALKQNGGNIWSGVITFEKDFGSKHCSTSTQAYNSMKNVFDKFLDSTHLSSKNIEWLGSLHENTDNFHIHYTFYEKAPFRKMKDGTTKYTFKGNVREQEIDYLKQSFFRYFTFSQINLYDTRDKIMDYLKSDFKDVSENGKLFKDFKTLVTSLNLKKGTKYKDLNPFQKKMVDDFSMKIIRSDDEIKNHYIKTFSKLAEAEREMNSFDKARNKREALQSKSETFRQDLFKRMGGIVLQGCEEVRDNIDFCKEKIDVVYASERSSKQKSASVRMIKKGLSKITYKAFKWILRENNAEHIKKNFHWLKILNDKEEEERKQCEKVR